MTDSPASEPLLEQHCLEHWPVVFPKASCPFCALAELADALEDASRRSHNHDSEPGWEDCLGFCCDDQHEIARARELELRARLPEAAR